MADKDFPSKSEVFGTFETLSDRLDALDLVVSAASGATVWGEWVNPTLPAWATDMVNVDPRVRPSGYRVSADGARMELDVKILTNYDAAVLAGDVHYNSSGLFAGSIGPIFDVPPPPYIGGLVATMLAPEGPPSKAMYAFGQVLPVTGEFYITVGGSIAPGSIAADDMDTFLTGRFVTLGATGIISLY